MAAPFISLLNGERAKEYLIRALEMQNIKSFSVIGAQESAKSSKASEAGALWARFRKSSREHHHGKVKAYRDAKGDEEESRGRRGGMCPPIRPLGPAQRVPAGKTTEKKEARKTFVLQTYTGKTVVLRTPCFPSDSCFKRFARRRRWAAAQTRLRDSIPQTPIFASRV